MKLKIVSALFAATCFFTACDNTTDNFGFTTTDMADNLTISTDTFVVSTRSILADSVLSRNTVAYLGKVRDPETGAYVTGDCMIQFYAMENVEAFPPEDSISSLEDGEVIADSCDIRLYDTDYYGDSLQTMKFRLYELDEPFEESNVYYSNFDPLEEGLIRTDGLQLDKVFSLVDKNVSDSLRSTSSYSNHIKVQLNDSYTDKDGVTYNNIGTYFMRKYYSNPEYYQNSYTFIHNLLPGFFFKLTSGLGGMAYIDLSRITVYYRYLQDDSIVNGSTSFAGTEEVLQTTTFTNDDNRLEQLAADSTCTYLKTPAGIFTEMTLPVDDIMEGHTNDTINTAKITLKRINNTYETEWELDVPQTLLMIPKSQLYSFFENGKIADYKSSFLAYYNSSTNSYTFNNISGMISYLNLNRDGDDWNKVVIIPVTTSTVTVQDENGSSETILSSVVHDMSLSSTKLVGGSANPYEPIKISVIYSKFE